METERCPLVMNKLIADPLSMVGVDDDGSNTDELMITDDNGTPVCDCYNYCGNSKFANCCEFGGACSISCDNAGPIIAGCTWDDKDKEITTPDDDPEPSSSMLTSPNDIDVCPMTRNRREYCPSLIADVLEAIDEETVGVAIGHVHWADGTLFKLDEIRQRLNDVDGFLFVDGTQSVGALPFDLETIKPDVLVCAGYKWLMGPYSIGLAYYNERFDKGEPLENNWINRYDSENFRGLVNYQDKYREAAYRYNVGEQSNFILLPMLNAAVKQVLKWGPESIQSYCMELMEDAITYLGRN